MKIVIDLRLMYISGRMNAPISKHGEVESVWLMWKPLLPKSLSVLCNLRRVEVGWGTQEASIVKVTISRIYDLKRKENGNSFSTNKDPRRRDRNLSWSGEEMLKPLEYQPKR